MLFKINLVSKLSKGNKKLNEIANLEEPFPLVFGTATDLPLVDLKTGKFTILSQDLKHDETGWIDFKDTSLMPTSHYVWIDSELLKYTSKTSNKLYITARAQSSTIARPHQNESFCTSHGTYFDYGICIGAINSISGFKVQPDSTNKTSDLVTARYNQWPPNIGVVKGRTDTKQSTSWPRKDLKLATYTHNVNSIYSFGYNHNLATGNWVGKTFDQIIPDIEINEKYSVIATIKILVSSVPADSVLRLTFGYSYNNVPTQLSHFTGLSIIEITKPSSVYTDFKVTLNPLTYKELRGQYENGGYFKFACLFEAIGGDCSFTAYNVNFEINYNYHYTPPANPQEYVRSFIDNQVCNVTSKYGANLTPPFLIKKLIEDFSPFGGDIDQQNFDNLITQYNNASFWLNGIVKSNITLYEALKKVLSQGLLRFQFNSGKIKLISNLFPKTTIDREILNHNIFLKSSKIEHYSTQNIKNKFFVKYGIINGEYKYFRTRENQISINKFGKKEFSKELSLVRHTSTANVYIDNISENLSKEPKVLEISVFLNVGFALEKGDLIKVPYFFDKRMKVLGIILSLKREFASGKLGKMNKVTILITKLKFFTSLHIEENLIINDNALSTEIEKTHHLIENINLNDTNLFNEKTVTTPLIDEITINENLNSERIIKQILVDTIEFNDNFLTLGTCNGYGGCGYGKSKYGV